MGNPFDKFDKAANPFDRFDAKAPDVNRGMRDEFGNALLLNAGDEAKAGIRAAVGPTIQSIADWAGNLDKKLGLEGIGGGAADFQNSPMGQASTAPDIGTRYDEELAKGRASSKAFETEHPNLAMASNLAGNVVGSGALMAALPAGLTSVGPSLIGNVAKGAAVGAGLSGTAGFGQGEGGFENRLGSALLPATLGAALGGAAPLVGAAGRSLMESSLGRTIAKNVAENGMIQRLATALQRGKIDPAQAGSRLDELGPYGMLADVDPQMASMARSARSMPGGTRSYSETVLDARQNQMPGIVRRAFEGADPPPSRYALAGEKGQYAQTARDVGRQAYQGDMVEGGLNQTPELRALLDQPAVSSAIKRVTDSIKEARAGRPDSYAPSPVEVMHMVKQEIQKLGQDPATGRPLSTQQVWRDLSDEFVSTLKSANPKLAEADVAYAQAKSLPEFFDTGHKFLSGATTESGMNSSAPALADLLMGATPGQTSALRAGSTNAVREMTGGRNAIGQTRSIARDLPAEGIAPKIEQIYGAPQAQEIQRAGNAVRTFDKTDKFIRGGSQSVDKALEVIEDASNIGLRGGPQGITARAWENIGALAQRLLGPNEAIRDAIGKGMLNPDSAESRRILALAAELMKKRAAGSPIRAGLIEGAASQAGGQ